MIRWHDPQSERDVFVMEAATVADWPDETPWACAGFGLFVAAEHVLDLAPLAAKAVAHGLAYVCAWGPASAMVEEMFDDAIVDANPRETGRDVIFTTSHPDESLEEALEFFLDVEPAEDRAAACKAFCVVAFGDALGKSVKRALERRGAKRT